MLWDKTSVSSKFIYCPLYDGNINLFYFYTPKKTFTKNSDKLTKIGYKLKNY